MDSSRKIVIGTRGSELALKQTEIVSQALLAAYPSLAIETRIIVTTGDTNQSPIPMTTTGKGWFTKEIEEALLAGSIDIAVHSLKDVGEKQPEGLKLAAYLPREDARDALIAKNGESMEDLPEGAIIGTDSPRRQAQMRALRPDVQMKSLRGNVLTRLKKLDGTFDGKDNQKYDAIILAVAGLKRLGLEKRITRIFEPDEMTPAPGQGILAIESRDNDGFVQEILSRINDAEAMQIARIERSFSKATGAGCKSPTGAYAFRTGNNCRLIGMVARDDGSQVIRGEMEMPWDSSDTLGELLARDLLSKLAQK